jgi:hypothetical protein
MTTERIHGVIVRYWDSKAVERGRYKAVVAHEIDQLRQASLAEKGKCVSTSRLWKHTAIHESRRDIVAGSLLFCEVTCALPGRQCRQSGIADLVPRFCYRRVSVDFVRRFQSYAYHEDHELPHGIRFVTVQKAAPTSGW